MAEKLATWARRKGIHPKTAYSMWREGRLPVPSERLSERVILVHDPEYNFKGISGKTVIYARVSSNDQKSDLERQAGRAAMWATTNKKTVSEIVTEIGSGMNENRPKLNRILMDPTITEIIVEHRERLSRFNFHLIQSSLNASERTITVIDNDEIEDDIVRDMTEFLTSVAARLYGKRSAENRAKRAIEVLRQ